MIPALGPADLLVRRLRLLAPAGAGAGEAEALRARLARTDWPQAGGEAWVLVRRLAVRGEPAAVGSLVAGRLAQALREAVAADGDGAAVAAAGAVRFADLTELSARLAADLAAGRAAGLWYWRQWPELLRLGVPEALTAVLGAHPERLATLTARLAGQGALTAVWRVLTPAGAREVQGRLAVRIGAELPAAADGDGSLDDPVDDPVDASGYDGAEAPAGLPPLPGALRARWTDALAGLGRRDPRRRLAACLVALEWRPLWIGGVASGRRLDALGTALGGLPTAPAWGAGGGAGARAAVQAGAGVGTRQPAEGTPPPAAGRAAVHPPVPGLVRSVAPADPRLGAPLPGGVAAPAPRASAERVRTAAPGPAQAAPLTPGPGAAVLPPGATAGRATGVADGGGDRDAGGGSPARGDAGPSEAPAARWMGPPPVDATPSAIARPAAGPPPEPAPEPDLAAAPDYDLETGQGGLFYLVNFLARPEAQALLRAGREAAAFPAACPGASAGPTPGGADGWWWLWDQGRRLGLASEGALGRFLAERLGLAGPERLAALPDLPVGADLAALAVRLYGREEVWNPDLLWVPARVYHSPSHLDIDYPLAGVRLPVRLVALDVNPGWVPWLGRVLTFRYLESWPVAGGPGPAR